MEIRLEISFVNLFNLERLLIILLLVFETPLVLTLVSQQMLAQERALTFKQSSRLYNETSKLCLAENGKYTKVTKQSQQNKSHSKRLESW